MKKRYKIDLDIGSKIEFDLTGFFAGYYGWVCPMYVTGEGNGILDLLDELVIQTCLSAGESGPDLKFTHAPKALKDLIWPLVISEYLKQVKSEEIEI